MSKKTLRFPDFPKNPDPRDALVDRAVKNAADLYLAEVATNNQCDFISANWATMVPIIQNLITTGILQGWELRGLDCIDCPYDKT
ncbi:MAG: hypothetical protein K2O91_05720 [Lachnospiraceae bacterium]|nr:hypothetical protein [Lachnospiraceae bacterium]